jgi:hypothetical protein
MERRRAEGAMPQLGNKVLAFSLRKSTRLSLSPMCYEVSNAGPAAGTIVEWIGNSLSTASKCMKQ